MLMADHPLALLVCVYCICAGPTGAATLPNAACRSRPAAKSVQSVVLVVRVLLATQAMSLAGTMQLAWTGVMLVCWATVLHLAALLWVHSR